MSQRYLDNLLLLALFLTAVGDLIGLFVEIKSQREACKQENSEQELKKEIHELHNELNLLKIEVKKTLIQ